MAEIKTEQEPSIEEILESIRQIISEDGTPVDAATAAAKPAKPAESIAAPVPPKPKQIEAPRPLTPPPPARPEPILDLTERVVEAPKPAPRIELEESPEEDEAVDDTDHLVSDDTADAAVASLARLLANNISVERELPGRPGNVTLEDMTREVLKPLLRQWLDQNLQHVIEKMVAREIERLSLRALEK
ncbi:MAG: DUF2497 domain-containing protein [bacterium]|nr:DUF2497 domain-containing protein [bacterium]